MTEPTNHPTPVILSDEQVAEIEARAKKYKGLADRAATPADTEVIRWFAKQVAALCQTVRALESALQKANEVVEEGIRANTALREQLAEAHTWIDRKNAAIETWQQQAKGNAERLAQVEKERERLLRGEFTPEEFQDLCHNVDIQEGFDVFADGCEAYQQKLFGRCRTKGKVQ